MTVTFKRFQRCSSSFCSAGEALSPFRFDLIGDVLFAQDEFNLERCSKGFELHLVGDSSYFYSYYIGVFALQSGNNTKKVI